MSKYLIKKPYAGPPPPKGFTDTTRAEHCSDNKHYVGMYGCRMQMNPDGSMKKPSGQGTNMLPDDQQGFCCGKDITGVFPSLWCVPNDWYDNLKTKPITHVPATDSDPCLTGWNPSGPSPGPTPHSTPGPTPHSTPVQTPHSTPGPTPHSTPGPTPHSTPHSTPGPSNNNGSSGHNLVILWILIGVVVAILVALGILFSVSTSKGKKRKKK